MDRKINAAAFKAGCLALIDGVAESGEPITITFATGEIVSLGVREIGLSAEIAMGLWNLRACTAIQSIVSSCQLR